MVWGQGGHRRAVLTSEPLWGKEGRLLLDCWEQQLRKVLLRVAGCREQLFFRVEVAQGLVKHMDVVT